MVKNRREWEDSQEWESSVVKLIATPKVQNSSEVVLEVECWKTNVMQDVMWTLRLKPMEMAGACRCDRLDSCWYLIAACVLTDYLMNNLMQGWIPIKHKESIESTISTPSWLPPTCEKKGVIATRFSNSFVSSSSCRWAVYIILSLAPPMLEQYK